MEPSFDFERGLDPNVGQPSRPPADMPAAGRKNYRMVRPRDRSARVLCAKRPRPPQCAEGDSPSLTLQTVCRHWLRGLCMKGNACGFLHQFEAARMPVCRFFSKYGECKVWEGAPAVDTATVRRFTRGCTARSPRLLQEPDCPFKHSSDDIKVRRPPPGTLRASV